MIQSRCVLRVQGIVAQQVHQSQVGQLRAVHGALGLQSETKVLLDQKVQSQSTHPLVEHVRLDHRIAPAQPRPSRSFPTAPSRCVVINIREPLTIERQAMRHLHAFAFQELTNQLQQLSSFVRTPVRFPVADRNGPRRIPTTERNRQPTKRRIIFHGVRPKARRLNVKCNHGLRILPAL